MSESSAATQKASWLALPVDGIRTVLQGLWACRVSLLSVAAGVYVLWNVPQAHDLFVELHTGDVGLRHWAIFFASVLVFWILPVHLSARLMLEAHSAANPTLLVSRGSRIVAGLPWLLSLVCLLAIGMALFAARRNLPEIEPGAPEQVRSLQTAAKAQIETLMWITAGLVALFLVVWFLVYPLLVRLTRRTGLLDTWLVRTVAALLFDFERRLRAAEAVSDAEREEIRRLMTRRRQIAVAALLLALLWIVSWGFVIWRPVDVPAVLRRAPMLPIVFGAWVPILTLPAYLATRWRLPLLAFFVVGLSVFGAFGRDYHAVRLLQDKPTRNAMLAGVCFPDHRAPGAAAPKVGEARQIGLEKAIEMWREVNGCAYGQGPCQKRPIIVAAEGGASRAAFFTGSVLSYIQDTSPEAPSGRSEFSQQLFAISSVSGSALGAASFVAALDHTDHTKPGGLGTRPALIATKESPQDVQWFRNRFPSGETPSQAVTFNSWVQPALKSPLQVILSGDFLSPVAAGLGLDVWWRLHCEDRAAVIERAWEDRFAAFLPPPAGGNAHAHGLARPLSSFVPTAERWRPLLIFNGSSVSTGRRIVTSTLHPLTTKRLDETPAVAARARAFARRTAKRGPQPEFEPVLGDTYDFYDHLCQSSEQTKEPACQCTDPKTPRRLVKGCDIRLSTAVGNSARFPVVAPQGDIRDPASDVEDRVVDGGYFDNFGVLTATEVATQLRAIDKRMLEKTAGVAREDDILHPFILLISNDPEFHPQACADIQGGSGRSEPAQYNTASLTRSQEGFAVRPAPPPPSDQSPVIFSMLRYPIDAAMRSWTASARTAPTRLGLLSETQFGFGVVQVCPQYLDRAKEEIRRVSMNWWVSMPVQAFLDAQVCAKHNDVEFRDMAALLNGKSQTASPEAEWLAWNREWNQLRALTCGREARPEREVEYVPQAKMRK